MIELQDIVQKYGQEFKQSFKIAPQQLKAFSAIRDCRTEKLGSNVYTCDSCGHVNVSYNSCRNRNCNKCQSLKRHQWMEERLSDTMPVPYFHVVFTVPQELNALFLGNLKPLLGNLFMASSIFQDSAGIS